MGAVFLAAFVCVLLLVALFSVGPTGSATYPALPRRLHERYLFYVVPPVLILFLAWLYRRPQIRRRVFAALLLLAALLPLALPYSPHARRRVPGLALLPWNNSLIAGRHGAAGALRRRLPSLADSVVRRRSILLLRRLDRGLLLLVAGLVATIEIRQASTKFATSYRARRVDRPRGAAEAGTSPCSGAAARGWPLGRVLAREHELWRAESSIGRSIATTTRLPHALRAARHARAPHRRGVVRPEGATTVTSSARRRSGT